MRLTHVFLAIVMTMPMTAIWVPTEVSRRWIKLVDDALTHISMKVRASHMGLTEKQIYDQFVLRQPMHADRLEWLFHDYPDAAAAYHIKCLEDLGYRCFKEAWLLALIDHVSAEKKPMAAMTLALPERKDVCA